MRMPDLGAAGRGPCHPGPAGDAWDPPEDEDREGTRAEALSGARCPAAWGGPTSGRAASGQVPGEAQGLQGTEPAARWGGSTQLTGHSGRVSVCDTAGPATPGPCSSVWKADSVFTPCSLRVHSEAPGGQPLPIWSQPA